MGVFLNIQSCFGLPRGCAARNDGKLAGFRLVRVEKRCGSLLMAVFLDFQSCFGLPRGFAARNDGKFAELRHCESRSDVAVY